MWTGHALEFDVRQVAEVIDEAIFECRKERLAIAVFEGGTGVCELFLEELVGLALADESRVAVAFTFSRDEGVHYQVERDRSHEEYPEQSVPMRSRRFRLVRNRVDESDIAAEEFNFLFLYSRSGGPRSGGDGRLVNRFCGGVTLFDFYSPWAS